MDDMTTEPANKVPKEDNHVDSKAAAKWKKLILAVDDRDEIELIQSLCSARLDIGRAEHKLGQAGKPKPKKGNEPSIDDYRAPKKMKPMSVVEPENLDEVS
jgi:hypothetical protein